MLHLDAAIHDDGYAARLGDTHAFLVDHPELTPKAAGADLHCLGGDCGQCVGRTKDVDDVYGNGDVEQTLAARFAEDFGFARVHGNDVVPVPFEVVPDEVAGAQVIFRQPDNGHRLRVVKHALNGQ